MTIERAVELFMVEQKFRNNTEKTVEYYKIALELFCQWLPDSASTDNLDIYTYKSYVIDLQARNISSTSVNSYTRAVKAFYNFLISEEIIPDISRKLKLSKADKPEIEPLTDDEIMSLLSYFDEDNKLQLRNKCLVMLMLDSGLRRGETISLHIGNVNFCTNIMLVTGKGRKQRFVPLGEQSRLCLRKYVNFYRCCAEASEPLFVDRFGNPCNDNTIKQVFAKLKKYTGIERLHPHLLRHTFATQYIVNGGNLEMLRLIMGHSSITVTQIYLHLANNIKLMQETHNSHLDKLLGGE